MKKKSSKVESYLSRLVGFEITIKQLIACRYLEKKGFKFFIDFGFKNAENLAKEVRKDASKRPYGSM